MLSRTDLLALAAWCRERQMTCALGHAAPDQPAVLLARRGRGADTLMLVVGETEHRLIDLIGQQLAAASDLPALLDAVDAGVADPGPLVRSLRSRPGGPSLRITAAA